MNYKSIVCPVDDSDISDKALDAAASLGRLSGARLTLVNVVEKWYRAEPLVTDSKEWRAIHEEWLSEGRKLLDEAAEKVKTTGINQIETILSDGDAAYEIIAAAKAKAADLIVMASPRSSPVTKLFLGSVIDRVTKNAPCPVLWIME